MVRSYVSTLKALKIMLEGWAGCDLFMSRVRDSSSKV